MSVNKCLLLGNLGQDPETKYTQNGNAVTNLSLATTERFKDKSGNNQEKTEWHRIVVWGKQAENCAQYLSKGSKVYVEGKIETRSWEGKDGKKNYTTEIKAQNVQFLNGANQSQDNKPASPQGGFNLDASNVSTDSSFTTEDIPF